MADTPKPSKLTKLLSGWPKGTVAVQRWLKKQGVSRQLADRYCAFGWLRRLERGAYARLSESVEWTGALYAVQYQLDLPVHAGAKTALEFQGYGHYVPLGEGARVQVFGPQSGRLPAWFTKHDWKVSLKFVPTNLFHKTPEVGLTEKDMGDYRIRLSSPERAILEYLDQLPRTDSFEEAKFLMEGLNGLRPDILQQLLNHCRSVKAKRLFLFFAEYCEHQWVKDLNLETLDLGRGKRVLCLGGHLDPKYQITVPFDRLKKEEALG